MEMDGWLIGGCEIGKDAICRLKIVVAYQEWQFSATTRNSLPDEL